MKEEIIKLLKSTNREGIDKVIEFMEKSDFFTAPASTRFHGAYEGGLAAHSFKVYEILKYKIENNIEDIQVPEESIIISALLMFVILLIPGLREIFSIPVLPKENIIELVCLVLAPIVIVEIFKLLKINGSKDE